jgi:hypothetical protein
MKTKQEASVRNLNKIKFQGETLTKARTVHALVAEYIYKKKPTLKQLEQAFPNELLNRYGIFKLIHVARVYTVNGRTRYYFKKEDQLKTKDGKTIVVCNQFSNENIKPFLKQARILGLIKQIKFIKAA